MKFAIGLSEGRKVTPAAYLRALRLAQANPEATFAQSFRSSWIPATGAEIVSQHWRMVYAKWASQYPERGKGNRAKKRAQQIRDARATCKWCGQSTGAEAKRFCSDDCGRNYNWHLYT